jgi:UDP-4-amino-4,6-dideoxy-N-acetyl-beta-L-altrosamine N-acetyltransferase
MTIEFENILNVSNDLKQLVRTWRNSDHVCKYMITNHNISIEEHQRWLEKLKANTTQKTWIIKYKKKPIGLISLSDINLEKKTAEWGFYIADESIRGKGIGSKVLYELMEYVFDTLHLQTMSTKVLGDNLVALRMYEKFGFRKVTSIKQSLVRDKETIDIFVMLISRAEWLQIKKTLKKEIKQNAKKLKS